MSVIHANQNNFRDVVINSDKPVLLDFWASWCRPCRMVAPILDEIAEEREDIRVVKINVDEEPELARRYQIISIPTLMVIEHGQVVKKVSGARSKAAIENML